MKKLIILAMILLGIPLIFAQTNLTLEHVGYGKNGELFFNVRNTGNTTINNFTVYDNNESYRTIKRISMGPGVAVEQMLRLERGQHSIQIRTEGAYSNIIKIFSIPFNSSQVTIKEDNKPETNKLLYIIPVAILIILLLALLFGFRINLLKKIR